jgi:flagellar export protein FliJ
VPFHFPLEGCLRHRRWLEQQAERQLAQSAHAVAVVRVELASLKLGLTQARLDRRTALEENLTGAELHFADWTEVQHQLAVENCGLQLTAAELGLVEQQKAVLGARRERKVVERLRELRWADYEREVARREQQILDDRFLQRRQNQ